MTLEAFWPPLLRHAQDHYDLSLVASGATAELAQRMGIRAGAFDVSIQRRPAPLADWKASRRLRDLFRRERFDIVHSQTPKAGMLAMTAARRAGVPTRVHTFTGQVWATRTGPWRAVLRAIDRRTARSATAILADSRSQGDFLIREGVVDAASISVLHHGSMCGVDAARFAPHPAVRGSVRASLGADDDDTVILFVGRLDPEKGIHELLAAFSRLAASRPRLRLWLVGPDEGAAASLASVPAELRPRVALPGPTRTPERFMAAADLLALPSHREGFGSTVIEAAACAVPAVASRIYGLTDAVIEGETGLLHEPRSIDDLSRALAMLADDRERRRRMGDAAMRRARRDFDPAAIATALLDFYERQRRR